MAEKSWCKYHESVTRKKCAKSCGWCCKLCSILDRSRLSNRSFNLLDLFVVYIRLYACESKTLKALTSNSFSSV